MAQSTYARHLPAVGGGDGIREAGSLQPQGQGGLEKVGNGLVLGTHLQEVSNLIRFATVQA